ncbi:AraC family transcriptional regulator [Ramlibacter sp. G-1-2-2]|uniref:AraC family transcriptional regulator n=1 Tax=Ramlibacter agri TaxID=2728837 RepID=A0A848H6S9_9BURK|nr:hemerythrin domain-containing protein [Ramlibacter agri]NML45211.1 AraC family transcriptional regulator [Ramlibacter agri]
MANPIAAWHQEHAYFNRLLALLQREMDVFHAGGSPDYQLMLDIITYLREYGDHSHHPREDEAFRRLLRHCPERALPIARLQQEHRVIAHAGEALREMLESVVADGVVQRAEVEMAAATYLVYYGNHIAREEEDVLPRAAKHLSAEDWQAVKEAAPAVRDPLFGPEPAQRFQELRRRIAA